MNTHCFTPWPENRLDTWRQDTPKDQLLALLGTLLGELDSAREGP